MKVGDRIGPGRLALVGVALLLSVGVSRAQRGGGLIPKGAVDPDAALLYTGDVIGFIDPCG